MFKYNCLNAISEAGLKSLSSDFVKTDDVNEAEAILVRSAAMHDMEFSDNLLAVARAGAGVNNIPLDKCAEKGIVVFNTPGANANGVKELVIAAMILTSRNLIAANGWVNENKDDGEDNFYVHPSTYFGTYVRVRSRCLANGAYVSGYQQVYKDYSSHAYYYGRDVVGGYLYQLDGYGAPGNTWHLVGTWCP